MRIYLSTRALLLSKVAMSISARPCPFHAQGRCLFGENCNFTHGDSAEPDSTSFASYDTRQSPRTSSPFNTVRSPPRSPRTSSLLLALKDIIGEDPDDLSIDAEDGESLTLVYNNNVGNVDETIKKSQQDPDSWSPTTSPSQTTSRVTINTIESSPDIYSSPPPRSDTPDTSGLLSPVEFSDLQLISLRQEEHDYSGKDGDSIDSGYGSWSTPQPLARSPPRSPALSSTFDLLASPFGSPSLRFMSPRLTALVSRGPVSPMGSTFGHSPRADDEDLPLDLSLDSPPSHDVEDVHQVTESDAIDDSQTARVQTRSLGDTDADMSGMSDESDYQRANSSSTDAITTSFFSDDSMSFDEDQAGQEEASGHTSDQFLHANSSANEEVTTGSYFSDDTLSFEQETAEDEEHETPEESSGSTSRWEAGENPTAVYVGMSPPSKRDVESAIRRLTSSPMNFLAQQPEEFSEEEIEASSSFVTAPSPHSPHDDFDDDFDSAGDVSERSPTAHLAYLSSQDDTLQSLYSVYSDLSEMDPGGDTSISLKIDTSLANQNMETPRPVRVSSDPSPALRQRVFTPPPMVRGRSGTVIADSPTSISSRSTSVAGSSRQVLTSDKLEGSDDGSSSKVPFGFRHSSLVGLVVHVLL